MSRGAPSTVELIEQLLRAPASGAEAPTLARLEDTLTEGYAQALALDAERERLADELSRVARRLTSAEDELTQLRSLLDTLYERARRTRRTARV